MRIGLDFINFDPVYSGGMNTFALGLARGVIRTKTSDDSVVFIVSEKNVDHLKSIFPDAAITFKILRIRKSFRIMNRLLIYLSWVLRDFRLRCRYDRYFRAPLMREIDDTVDALISPFTVLSLYALRKPSILSIHDIQQEYHPEFFTFRQRVERWAPYRASCEAATFIQVSSLYIQDCVLEKFIFVDRKKLFLAYEGVDSEKFNAPVISRQPGVVAEQEEQFHNTPAPHWPLLQYLLSR